MGRLLVELHVRDLGVIDDVTVELGPGMTALTGETGSRQDPARRGPQPAAGRPGRPGRGAGRRRRGLVEGRFVDADGGRRGRPGPAVGPRRAVQGLGRRAHGAASVRWPRRPPGCSSCTASTSTATLVVPEAQRRALDAFGAIDTGAARRRPGRGWPRCSARPRVSAATPERRRREAELLAFQVEEIDGCRHRPGRTRSRAWRPRRTGWPRPPPHRAAAAMALEALAGSMTTGDGAGCAWTGWPRPPGPWPVGRPSRRWTDGCGAAMARARRPGRRAAHRGRDLGGRPRAARPRSGPAASSCTSSGASTGRPSTDVLATADGPGPAGRAGRARGAGRRTRRRDRPGPGRGGRAPRRWWPGRGGVTAPLLASEIETTLHDLAMPSARFTIRVEGEGSARPRDLRTGRQPGRAGPAAGQGGVGRRAVPHHAGRAPGPDRRTRACWSSTRWTPASAARPPPRWARPWPGSATTPRCWWSPTWPRWRPRPTTRSRCARSRRGGRTRSEVTVLDPEARVVEISRMLSGSPDSESARRHARELLGDRGPGRRAGTRPVDARGPHVRPRTGSGSLGGCPMRMAPT